MLPILNPPPSSLPIPSLWVIPVHQPQASSLKALCLLNLIPWIYLSPPLYNHKGFVFVHSPSHVRLFVTPWTTASQASLPNTIFLSEWVIVNQSCPTLCNPMRCSLPGSFVHEILQAGILEWVAISHFPLSNLGGALMILNVLLTGTEKEYANRNHHLSVFTNISRWAFSKLSS